MRSDRYTIDIHDAVRNRVLHDVWEFNDVHDSGMAPEFVHRLRANVKHMNAVGEGIIIINNSDENVDVYLEDSP